MTNFRVVSAAVEVDPEELVAVFSDRKIVVGSDIGRSEEKDPNFDLFSQAVELLQEGLPVHIQVEFQCEVKNQDLLVQAFSTFFEFRDVSLVAVDMADHPRATIYLIDASSLKPLVFRLWYFSGVNCKIISICRPGDSQ